MRRNVLAACVLFAIAAPLHAHHGDTNFELAKETSVEGVVTDFKFVNPHILITFEVTDAGTVTKWMAQGTSPNMLVHRGWTHTTIKPGDKIALTGNRARNGAPAMKVGKLLVNGKDPNQ